MEVANISATDALFGTENSNVFVASGPKPTLAYYAPAQPARDTIVLIISTPSNPLSEDSDLRGKISDCSWDSPAKEVRSSLSQLELGYNVGRDDITSSRRN